MLKQIWLGFTQVGPYSWLTYQEAYDAAIRMGSAMKSRGVNPVSPNAFLIYFTFLLCVFFFDKLRENPIFKC